MSLRQHFIPYESREEKITSMLDLLMKISNMFQIMAVERITHHSLQGQIFLEIEVSMPPDMSIR